MKTNTKTILIVLAVLVVLIVGVAFYYYRKGKKQVTIQAPPLDNPTGGNGSQQNNPYGVSDSQILAIAGSLHKDMEGFNWNGHDIEPFQNLNALSDSDFVRVYNVFNSKYQAESEETLKQWIESETFVFDDVIDSILSRMARLNLL